ncbi:MAG: endonuclease/exonuclease/phosphatase family protein [Ilumatobacteraceae bacterium]
MGRSLAQTVASLALWATAAVGVGVTATQLTGWNRSRWVAILQSFTPALAITGVPVAAIGFRRRRLALVAAGLATSGVLGAIVVPATRRRTRIVVPGQPAPRSSLSIAHCNMLYLNIDRSLDLAAALLWTDADVLAMSEITEHHRRALVAAGAFDRYPHRVGRVARRSEGIVLWSRFPLHDVMIRPIDSRPGIVATVETQDGPIRVVLAHPDPPTMARGLSRWKSSFEMIDMIASSPGPPTVIVADLNASRWHPLFRRLLDCGWRDAHELAGRGLAPSWPTDRRFVPPFIRLDHALLGPGLELVDAVDVDAPGSDHRAFLVSVVAL